MKFRMNAAGMAELRKSPQVVAALGKVAQSVADAAEGLAPHWIQESADFIVRAGVNRDDEAFAQAIARGSGTVFAEYGDQPYMRPAMRSAR